MQIENIIKLKTADFQNVKLIFIFSHLFSKTIANVLPVPHHIQHHLKFISHHSRSFTVTAGNTNKSRTGVFKQILSQKSQEYLTIYEIVILDLG